MSTYIPIPQGMEIPQGAVDGEEFDLTARAKLDDGKICLVSINGIPLPKESESDDEEGMMEKMRKMTPSEAAMMYDK